MLIGYLRVSTADQNTDLQRDALLSAGIAQDAIYSDRVYDTEYAMVDREDDRKIGIRTSALTFGRHDVAAVMGCHSVFLLIMVWIGRLFWPGWYFHLGVLIAAGLVLAQYRMIRGRDPAGCFRAFQVVDVDGFHAYSSC